MSLVWQHRHPTFSWDTEIVSSPSPFSFHRERIKHLLLLLRLLVVARRGLDVSGDGIRLGCPALIGASQLPLTRGLVAQTASLKLVRDRLLTRALGLRLVDVLHEGALVLENVTLAAQVQLVVQVLVNLLRLTVLAQQPAQDTHAAQPQDLSRHTRLLGTPALTRADVAALALGDHARLVAGAGVDLDRLADHEAILDELAHVLAGVGHGDLIDLRRVQPDLALAAAEHGGGQQIGYPNTFKNRFVSLARSS